MPDPKEQAEYEALAALHDGLGHPVRVAALHALRKRKSLTTAELKRAVSQSYTLIDSRRMQFHLYKMHAAGLVVIRAEGGKDVVVLKRDVTLRTKELE
jgi:DNA-binding transcriptional ArsR family regulator